MWVVLCCVVSRRCASPFPSRRRVAVPFGLYFGPPLCLFRESPHSLVCALPLAGIWWAPAIAPSRDLATPHPFVPYVVWLLAQSDMPVRWEDVHISSIGSKFSSTHPFSILLLTHVILPRLWRQRNGVRKLEKSNCVLDTQWWWQAVVVARSITQHASWPIHATGSDSQF